MPLVTRAPHPALARHVRGYYGFTEETGGPMRRREGPGSSVVVILSFEHEWRIGDAKAPARPFERHTSFIGGLRHSAVLTEHAGRSEAIQVNLTPQAAHALVRAPMHELSDRTVELEAVLGADAVRLVDRLAETGGWSPRFELLEAALAARLANVRPSPDVEWAWRRLVASEGRVRVGALCAELGWSRRRLAQRFREEIGLPAKSVARLLRLEHALELLERDGSTGSARLAAECGYYDQSHLINDFRDITGVTPGGYARDKAGVTFFQDAALRAS
jgi:AraC-like DNA-binding protein